jgi:hypothetical protein
MSPEEPGFSDEERRSLATKAVNRLIADAEAKRLLENKELAEVIAVCIRDTQPKSLRTLKFLLEQQEFERPDLQPPSA